MNVARLLSLCPDPPPPSQRQEPSSDATDGVETGSLSTLATTSVARQAPPSLPTATNAQQPLVKRKRKRRFSATQLQVMHENRRDESQLYNLTLDVNELKQQVRNCIVHKSIHQTRTFANRQSFEVGVLRTTWRFFEVFRTGFRDWEPHEAAFLDATIDSDIIISSELRGADLFFEQWRRYKSLLQVRFVSISSTEILMSDAESCVVECKGEFEGRLTFAAIETLFPHILQDVELLSKVVNSRLVCPTRSLIYFDASGRIVRYDANVDFFGALSHILATNPMDVITLMSNARISHEGSMIPDADYNDDRVEQVLDTETGECDLAPASPNDSDSVMSSGSPSSSNCSSRSSVGYILS